MLPLVAGDPSVVGSYRVLGRLGVGGMGCVYLGRTAGGRTVAVKVVRAELARDADFRARFRREVDAARRVGGSWTAPVLDADTEAAEPWVATGYVAGPALSQAVAEFGPLSEHGVRALVAGLAEALTAVHGLGLIHRDLKPSNVMLSLDGPVLIDFGIARAMDSVVTASLTSSGVVIGSPGYMSPEQVLGRPLGAASDVFQLGTVLAYAATGQGPFLADSAAALLYQVAHGEPELGSLHGELRALAESCLAKDPAARPTPQQIAAALAPGGAAELVTGGWLSAPVMAQLGRRTVDLLNLEATPEPAAEQAPEQAPQPTVHLVPPPTTPPATAPKRRHRAILAVSAAVVAAGLATTAVLLTRDATPTGIPAGFVGAWQGDVHGSSVMTESLNLSIFNPPGGARAGGPPIITGRDYLTVQSTQETGLCQPAYRKQQVTAHKLVLVRELADIDQGGPWCGQYFQGGTVEVSLTKDGSLDLRWKSPDGSSLQATLTKQSS